ncbi:MAG TPA: NADH-quinone oxidoreductase subunit N [Terriglobia bacterium]|nr:NADH-quinone oxidoreductase subunit N [Terriglobia bacterium]
MITPQPVDIMRILPEIVLSIFAVVVMVLEPFVAVTHKKLLGWMALLGILAAGAATTRLSIYPWPGTGPAFGGSVIADRYSSYFIYLFLLVAGLVILGSMDYLERDRLQHGEFYALILMGTIGMCFMASSTDLLMIFIGLEISSIATYILAGYRRSDRRSNEASLKYFLLGSFATAFLLYGIAFVYGLTGTTNLMAAGERLNALSQWTLFARVALALVFVGLAFKLSVAPFQIWAPDVYQGAPAPVTAFMSVGPKAAAFAVLLRLFLGSFSSAGPFNFWILWISAALTMCVGNLGALWQNNVKRLLAYSSIAHAGYVLVGVTAGGRNGISSVMYYLTAYALMNAGAFLLVAYLAGQGEGMVEIEDYRGLANDRPAVAACLTIFLLALAGFPATGGFLGKFYLFRAAIHSRLVFLTILALLNSVVSVYYYFKIIVAMYMHEGKAKTADTALPWTVRAAIAVSIIGIFYLGLAPNDLVGVLATLPPFK